MTTKRDIQNQQAQAELVLAETYDWIRRGLGHDYGCGQRMREMIRLSRSLDGQLVPEITPDDLTAAWARVAVPKIRRVRSEDYRRTTPATRRTMNAWKETRYALMRMGCSGVALELPRYDGEV